MRPDAHAVTAAVIVPARNEEARIGDCLRALLPQTEGVGVLVVANNCSDGTADLARDFAADTGLRIAVLECELGPGAGVGTARRLGCAEALVQWPGVPHLMTTDADCIVAPDWIDRNRDHLSTASAVCGHVAPMAAERSIMQAMDAGPARLEGRYEALVSEFYRRFRPGPCGLDGEHGGAAGASLAFRASAYLSVGGFAELRNGEDRDLIRRLKVQGHGVRHAGDVRVAASCRLDGRADGGMSAALRARVDRDDYLIDDGLPPAPVLIAAAARGTLGAWPLQVAPEDRLRASELAPHIAALSAALTAKPTAPGAPAGRQTIAAIPDR